MILHSENSGPQQLAQRESSLFETWTLRAKPFTGEEVAGGYFLIPRGSRHLIIKELGLKDHDYYGFCGLSP